MKLGPVNVDWDTGLPQDVLALVAKAGGGLEMKGTRGVSQSWQDGFDLGASSLSIHEVGHPVLPAGLIAGQRFAGLTKLDLGHSAVNPAWLENLGGFPNLECLVLGLRTTLPWSLRCLALQLSDFHMLHLQVRCFPDPNDTFLSMSSRLPNSGLIDKCSLSRRRLALLPLRMHPLGLEQTLTSNQRAGGVHL